MSVSDLARAVGRSESTARERIVALERDGVLLGYRAMVDPQRVGYGVNAIVRASADLAQTDHLLAQLRAMPNVVAASLTTGQRPVRIGLVARDLNDLERILRTRVSALGLQRIEVEVVIQELVPQRPPPVLPSESRSVVDPRPFVKAEERPHLDLARRVQIAQPMP